MGNLSFFLSVLIYQIWQDLVQKAKDGGVDVIDTYVFWNAHEPSPGNISRFVVHLRVGPYVCAEWNFGGFPVWLKYVPGISFRTDNAPFKNAMQGFTGKIVQMMKNEKLYASQGGPIILSQIENEYGAESKAFGSAGQSYLNWAARMAVGLNTGVPWVMCKEDDAPDPVHVNDADIVALVSDEIFQPEVVWKLGTLQVTSSTLGLSTSTVKLTDADGKDHVACSVGTGPVDSAYKAIDMIVKVPVSLLEYSMTAVTEGIDAIAATRVLIKGENNHITRHALTGEMVHRTYSGTRADMDIVVSSVRAYISALNKMLSLKDESSVKAATTAEKSSSKPTTAEKFSITPVPI